MTTGYLCRLAGLSHRPAEIQKAAEAFHPGTPLRLEREPTNKFDRNAIKVYAGDDWIGYVAGPFAAIVAPDIDAGRDVRCTVHSPSVRHEPPMLTIEVTR